MAEILTGTVVGQAPRYGFVRLILDLDAQRIEASVRDSNGLLVTGVWTGATAVGLMQALNTANLTNASLIKRILLKLQTDGYLPAGLVTGTPS